MPRCLKCGAELPVNEEGMAPVLCDRCAGVATSRARRTLSTGTLRDFPATSALMAINIAVFIGMVLTGAGFFEFRGGALIPWGGNWGPLTIGGEYWRLVTAGFVHSGLIHLAFNMWCLLSLGRLSEKLFGKWQTACIYLLTGVGGALLSIAYQPDRLEVGASGAIFGIAGALLAGLKFGNLSVSAAERKAIVSSMIFFVMVNFALGSGVSILGTNVDNMCHLGGFVTGLLIGLPMGAFARHHKLYQLATVVVTTLVLVAAGQQLVQVHGAESQKFRAAMAIQQRNYPQAIQFLEKYTVAKPDDDDAWVMLGQLYESVGQPDKAVIAYKQALSANPESEAAKSSLEGLHQPVPPRK